MLNGENLTLRATEESDLDVLYVWENDPEVWKMSHTLVPFSKTVLKRFIQNGMELERDEQFRFMIVLKSDGRCIGTLDLFEYSARHARVGVGILIADHADRGKGWAKEALELLTVYAREHLQLKQIYCNILQSNENSIQLFERVGYRRSGTKKDWIKTKEGWEDEHVYQLFL